MSIRILKMAVLGFFVVISTQTADAQYRGRGSNGGDRDGNSSDEMRRRFEEMRSRYSSGGDRGGSDRDRDEMRRRFEEMRSRYSGGDGGDRGGDFRSRFGGGDREGGDRDGGDSRSRFGGGDRNDRGNSRSRSNLYVPKPHDPIGVQLPGNYVDGDTDGDGQIALVEWRKWRPQEIANFVKMDTNKDGFLTARELIIAENFAGESPAAPAETYAYAAPVATPGSSGSDSDGNGGSDSGGGEKASAAEARYVFNALDKNRDGKISSDEWSGSKSVREGFEKAGIKLELPVDSSTFLDRYPPYRLVPQLRIPG